MNRRTSRLHEPTQQLHPNLAKTNSNSMQRLSITKTLHRNQKDIEITTQSSRTQCHHIWVVQGSVTPGKPKVKVHGGV
jgi:hypothetical protein